MKTYQFEKLDANENVFFGKQLESVKSKTYDIKYPEFQARKLIPVDMSAGAGAETIKYEQFDSVGFAKIVADYAKDFPRCDIKGAEFVSIIRSLGDSYGYSVQDIRAASMAGKPLQTRKAGAARRSMMQLEENIAYYGDSSHNLGGLLTDTNVPTGTLPADGTGALTTLVSKDPDKIIRDLNSLVNEIFTTTKGVEIPDTVLLPLEAYSHIASTPRSSTSDTTILEFFLSKNPFVKNVGWLNQLEEPTAGWASVGLSFTDNIALAYKRDPEKLTFEIPQDFEQFPAQPEGMDFVIPCHQRIGGVIIYYPLSMNIKEGV